ncbi:zinc ribbon domain-containing protein [Kribbella sp. NPDC003557]|uniref:zinc ribbon domain-containing protein n=1 Tax=Kribbella sp. NPDC003557 TaxID=3154449 RepID=UPI0033AA1DE5
MFRSRIKCGMCLRKMEGAARREDTIYYRCNSRTLEPGSATALARPPQIYLREDLVTPAVNRWIASLFDPMHRDETVTRHLEADDSVERDLTRIEQLPDRVVAAKVAM